MKISLTFFDPCKFVPQSIQKLVTDRLPSLIDFTPTTRISPPAFRSAITIVVFAVFAYKVASFAKTFFSTEVNPKKPVDLEKIETSSESEPDELNMPEDELLGYFVKSEKETFKNELTKELQGLKQENEKLKSEKETFKNELSELQEQIKSRWSEMRIISNNLKTLETTQKNSQNNIKTSENQLKELEDRKQKLKSEVEITRRQLKLLAKEKQRLIENPANEPQEELQPLWSETDSLKEMINLREELEQERQNLKSETESSVEKLKKIREEVQKNMQNVDNKIRTSTSQLKELEDRKQNLKNEIENLENLRNQLKKPENLPNDKIE